MDCKNTIYGCSLETILEEKKPIIISDVEQFSKIPGNEKLGTAFAAAKYTELYFCTSNKRRYHTWNYRIGFCKTKGTQQLSMQQI